MRRFTLVPVMVPILLLAACGENSGWNPNYQAGATPYGDYLRGRESALLGRRDGPPRTIPVVTPVRAPTPEEISGHTMRPVPETTLARIRKPAGAPSIDPYPSEPMLTARKTGTGTGQKMVVAAVPAAAAGTTAAAGTAGAPPTLAQYAASSTHQPGSRAFARPGVNYGASVDTSQACASYGGANAAQTAFLGHGGPAVDPLGLDPDGDGYVCGWTPAGFRTAAN